MKRICIYGKGGIGKSTTVANTAAALAESGKKVAVVGCDPKADSTRNLTAERMDTVLDCLMKKKERISTDGYLGIRCIESGGPEPGTGCAGRGIVAALTEIRARKLLDDRDIVLYDVLGDVVCGGFSAPMRENVADRIYLVTTDDYMSLYAANNICKGIRKYAENGEIRLAGIIHNARSSMGDANAARSFAEAIGTRVIATIPMDKRVSLAEIRRKTVIETFPDTEIAEAFRALARSMYDNTEQVIPSPLPEEELEALYTEQVMAETGG